MKRRYYVQDGKVVCTIKLSKEEQKALRKENINSLLEQAFYKRVFEETVSFADRNTHV